MSASQRLLVNSVSSLLALYTVLNNTSPRHSLDCNGPGIFMFTTVAVTQTGVTNGARRDVTLAVAL